MVNRWPILCTVLLVSYYYYSSKINYARIDFFYTICISILICCDPKSPRVRSIKVAHRLDSASNSHILLAAIFNVMHLQPWWRVFSRHIYILPGTLKYCQEQNGGRVSSVDLWINNMRCWAFDWRGVDQASGAQRLSRAINGHDKEFKTSLKWEM